ncbi:MAG: EAL domain-containing protein [Acidimicrobiales bacterium]
MSEVPTQHDRAGLRYLPVVDLVQERVVGVDVVTTWQGQSPAERRAQLARTDAQLLEAVAAEVAAGPVAAAGWWVGVALGHRRLVRPAGAERLLDVLHHAGLAPERVVLSVTEWELGQILAAGAVAPLSAEGVRASLVDVGSGHLRPADLRAVPLAHIRLDLTGTSDERPEDLELVGGLAVAARVLGADPVAEGVDGVEQLELARRAGIRLVRGVLAEGLGAFADPMVSWRRVS